MSIKQLSEPAKFTMKNDIANEDFNFCLTKSQRLGRIFLALTVAALLIAIYFWNPNTHPLTVCKFHQLTGVSCPTCGLSRSIHAAAHFRIMQSIKFHGTGWAILTMLMLIFGWTLAEAILGKRLPCPIPSKQKKLIFGGIITLWLFSWLMNMAKDLNLLP